MIKIYAVIGIILYLINIYKQYVYMFAIGKIYNIKQSIQKQRF
jgi:hypothetical protein